MIYDLFIPALLASILMGVKLMGVDLTWYLVLSPIWFYLLILVIEGKLNKR